MGGHRVLVGRLVAQVHAPADVVRVVGRGHVDAAVVEQDGAAGGHGQRQGLDRLQVPVVDLRVARAGTHLVVVRQHSRLVRTRPDLQAAVDGVRLHERNPDRDNRVCVGVRPVGLVLVPGDRAGGDAGDLRTGIVDGVGKDLRADQRLDCVQDLRIRHQVIVAGTALTPRAAVAQEVLVALAGEQPCQAALERGVCVEFSDLPLRRHLPGDLLDLVGHRLPGGGLVPVVQQPRQDEIPFLVIESRLFGGQKRHRITSTSRDIPILTPTDLFGNCLRT